MNIKAFTVNPFGVNAFVLSNSAKEAILIDPSFLSEVERTEIGNYIQSNGLKVCRALNTHLHLDHILGNTFVEKKFGTKVEAHKDDEFLLAFQEQQSAMYGLSIREPAGPLGNYLNEGDIVRIGSESDTIELRVIHIPGHSPGGLAFFFEGDKNQGPILFSGDILFNGGMGRTDLFGGNEEALVSGIKNKLFTLPPETIVYPGHGPKTTIGTEKEWF
ncbi:MAG: MBL fold metallo-hydrolase [Fibrobacteraceae bacterium]|nr:MBL fold metallo-hydrolase [Fibrobacteraceae bacterium]